ncbi:hypothetical protein D9615_010523 [Tricholomella constricta]|uniref:Uncharacterized protein n=1 Tax=Tricholomella constricta TaxID=117010 RepID=A0A8H5GNR5_9AGAR|nr:hypothetical protein D9615_010523 [Tricholomella constricta]
MLELSNRPPGPIEWALPFDLQQITIFRHHILDLSDMRFQLLQLLRCWPQQLLGLLQFHSILPGLGVCLSQLVNVPEPSGTSTPTPLPSITGINTPTPPAKRTLEWWQILLMALGCAFIFLVVIWLFRRRARKQRAKRTILFATTPGYNRTRKSGWRWRLIRFGEKLFGHRRSRKAAMVVPGESEAMKLTKLRAAEEARHEEDMVKLIGEYQHPSRSASPASLSRQCTTYTTHNDRLAPGDRRSTGEASLQSAPSIYSQMTGVPRKAPEPRQPLRKKDLTSRFSSSTYSSDEPGGSNSKNPFWK